MLKELRDFPREFFDIRLKEYSNGIISGCDIDVIDDFIKIKKGLIKYKDVLYLLKEDKKVKYECNNQMMILKVKFLPLAKDNDFIKNTTEVCLDGKLELEENEIEICRFKLRSGANLRSKHVDFNDLITEYDTVNTIYAPYAAYGASTLNPESLRRFGRELLECKLSEAWDVAFAMTCVQSKEAIQKEIIVGYLVNKLDIEIKDYTTIFWRF
jgi:hypothetical protein